jgi:hypothetical protein
MNWTTCKAPSWADSVVWHTPPACEGQIVLRQYASSDDPGVIYRRCWDQSDGSKTYSKRFLADDEEFEPWNGEPA